LKKRAAHSHLSTRTELESSAMIVLATFPSG
jgi:hypothetical protein